MADPEQIYQEVLQEEQQKGSATAVAEGRAKAARVRAEHGSPHPKEPRWWPGAQPHLEGDGAEPAEPSAEAAAVEEPAPEPEPAPPAAAPAPEPAGAPAAQPAPVPEPAPAAAAQAPAAQPAPVPEPAPAAAAQAPAAPAAQQVEVQPAGAQVAPAFAPEAGAPAAAAPATATQLPPNMRPAGVAHGTPSGNRLRPEDAVATDAQFAGQRAVLERRKLIDELVATGVPAVTASQVGRPRAPYLAVLYLLIPLLVVAVLLSQDEPSSSEPSGEAPAGEQPADGGGTGADVTLVAESIQFDTDSISLPAEQDVVVTLDNQDTAPHNFALYPDEEAGASQADALFQGENVDPAQSVDYEFTTPARGEYYFQCDVHPAMNGTAGVR